MLFSKLKPGLDLLFTFKIGIFELNLFIYRDILRSILCFKIEDFFTENFVMDFFPFAACQKLIFYMRPANDFSSLRTSSWPRSVFSLTCLNKTIWKVRNFTECKPIPTY